MFAVWAGVPTPVRRVFCNRSTYFFYRFTTPFYLCSILLGAARTAIGALDFSSGIGEIKKEPADSSSGIGGIKKEPADS